MDGDVLRFGLFVAEFEGCFVLTFSFRSVVFLREFCFADDRVVFFLMIFF